MMDDLKEFFASIDTEKVNLGTLIELFLYVISFLVNVFTRFLNGGEEETTE